MEKHTFSLIETYMLSCMDDSAHDKEHIYRVLFQALEIAQTEPGTDCDVLIAACLLHDIGRREQFENPALCHAQVGSEKAARFLREQGFPHDFVQQVAQCILTHRYRQSAPPQSLEAKILFDADKLDVTGAVGIARTLIYEGIVSHPLYTLRPDGSVSNGEGDTAPSFFQEYKYKLERLYSQFYTARGAQLARQRQAAAVSYYENLLAEIDGLYQSGRKALAQAIGSQN